MLKNPKMQRNTQMIFPLFFLSFYSVSFSKEYLDILCESSDMQIFKIFQYIIGPNPNVEKVIVKFLNILVQISGYIMEKVL